MSERIMERAMFACFAIALASVIVLCAAGVGDTLGWWHLEHRNTITIDFPESPSSCGDTK